MSYLIDNLTDNDKAKYKEKSKRAIAGIDILLSDISIILKCNTIKGKYFTIAQRVGLLSDNSESFYNYFIPTNAEILFLLRLSNHNNTNPTFYNIHERNGRPNKRYIIPFHGNAFQKQNPYEFLQAEQNVINYPVNALDDEIFARAFLQALRQLFIDGVVSFPELPQEKNSIENNQQTNENKTMKQTIRLTESDLHKLIKEVVNELDLKTYANAAKDDFEDKLYYSEELNREMLQLSDEHTLWKINNGVNDEYYYMVENGLDDLTRKFGTQFYALGRSGRHICVDDTPKNRKRYGKMVAAVEDAERSIIDFFNSERSLDESITRAIHKLLR